MQIAHDMHLWNRSWIEAEVVGAYCPRSEGLWKGEEKLGIDCIVELSQLYPYIMVVVSFSFISYICIYYICCRCLLRCIYLPSGCYAIIKTVKSEYSKFA